MKLISVFLATATALGVAGAQDGGFKWSLSGGPTLRSWSGWGDMVCIECSYSYTYGNTTDNRIIYEAQRQKFNAALGVSRRWAGSAITLRGEVLYNRAVSDGRIWRYKNDSSIAPFFFSDTITMHQSAPREEVLAATIGLQWDAFPDRRVSPYLLTSIGFGRMRTSWNSDTTSTRLDTHRFREFVPISLGAGIRAQVWKREAFIEWRRFGALFSDAPRIAPISFGLRF